MKEIIGYKLIKPEYLSSAISITGFIPGDDRLESFNNYFKKLNIEGNFIKSLKEAGVLELWFQPIYKAEKIEMKVLYEGGELNVVIEKKEIITVVGEGDFNLTTIKNSIAPHNKLSLNSFSVTVHPWKIDVGCKKGILVSDVEKVIAAHDKLFNL